MKLLIASRDAAEQERLLRVFTGLYEAEAIAEGESLVDAVRRTHSSLVITDASRIGEVAARRPRVAQIALIATTPDPLEFSRAFAAGADDVLRIGACREEVCGRVANLGTTRASSSPLPTLMMRIRALKAWNDLERIVADELGDRWSTPA
jgi:hypothetical protein